MLGMVMRLWLDSREKLMPDGKYEGLFGQLRLLLFAQKSWKPSQTAGFPPSLFSKPEAARGQLPRTLANLSSKNTPRVGLFTRVLPSIKSRRATLSPHSHPIRPQLPNPNFLSSTLSLSRACPGRPPAPPIHLYPTTPPCAALHLPARP